MTYARTNSHTDKTIREKKPLYYSWARKLLSISFIIFSMLLVLGSVIGILVYQMVLTRLSSNNHADNSFKRALKEKVNLFFIWKSIFLVWPKWASIGFGICLVFGKYPKNLELLTSWLTIKKFLSFGTSGISILRYFKLASRLEEIWNHATY